MIFRLTFVFFLSFFLFLQGNLFAQDIPIGTWRDHLPYSDAVSVAKNGDLVYCATNSAIFIYDNGEKTIERLNLVNGLSDIGISKIKYVPSTNRIVIAYQNGNVDIIKENKEIINLSFIKNSTTIGSKEINHIYIDNEFAYLSTGVGIVVLNTEKLEFVDTYNFDPSGNSSNTNAVTFDSLNIYAASDQGVFYANRNSPNLADFNSWAQIPELGSLKYNNILFFSNHLFVSYDSPVWLEDTVFYDSAGVWKKFPANTPGLNVKSLSTSNNKLIIVEDGLSIYDQSLTFIDKLYTFNGQYFVAPNEALIDADNYIWMADNFGGLIKTKDNWTNEQILPNGPSTTGAFGMDFLDDELWVVSGGYNIFNGVNLINHQSKGTWADVGKSMLDAFGNGAFDMVSVAINPNNLSNSYVGSWSSGLYEYNNDKITNIYNAQNSVLDSTFFGSTAIGALEFDNDNNLWVVSSFSTNILAVKTPDNNWYGYSFVGLASTSYNYTSMTIDDNNSKWMAAQKNNAIIVFNDNGTLDNTNDDQSILLTTNNNEIPGARLESIVTDLDGEVWIGTDEGIAVFYNPSDVFDQTIKAERIYIQQDGQTQILLETEIVTSIAIDGANRKWIGTQSSGVFLVNEDGTEELLHFTTANSPLFSNNIFDIDINQKTGEIFFGTAKGLISYKGTATEPDEDFNNVFVYPNPVKEDFTGTIAIRGLVEDTDVRITDVSGNIVYQTTSIGGQAIWDGKDMYGNKVQTGVYLIFNGSQDGQKKYAAKILFIH
jgi:ligand-binding sensor domain-containing protein